MYGGVCAFWGCLLLGARLGRFVDYEQKATSGPPEAVVHESTANDSVTRGSKKATIQSLAIPGHSAPVSRKTRCHYEERRVVCRIGRLHSHVRLFRFQCRCAGI